ncbi:PecA family PE domain-processing aspartic protease [Mycobacterium sp.]|uniref:PecA family PE domain-processing aspartic protease n=1 Tax=Mycobacterium sp. TaxID=1785 RepID=UPI003BB08079
MAGHDRKKQARSANVGRRLLVGMGAGASVFFAAAAMATGSAAPAKADFEDLLDPIIQPLLTSLTDSIGAFDPAAAVDLTSWTDSFLASLNSIDSAVPAASESAASAAVPAASDPTGTYDIPITMQEVTEPTVQATIDGTSNTLLVDTGSSGLVIPWESLGSNPFTALENLFELGSPIHSGFSGYSGGVEYYYLTYDTPVDYATTTGTLDTGSTPVDVEIFSYPTSFSSPANFETFVADNQSTGILGIGDGVGPNAMGPLQADGYEGVTVDIPKNELVVSPTNAGTPVATFSDASSGAPITALYESVNGGTPIAVSDDVDSGGVYGTIPSSLLGNATTVPSGTTISVYDNAAGTGTPLYTYQVGTDSIGNSTAPFVTSGTNIDSGVEPFLLHPIYIDYATDSLIFDK